MNYGKFNSDALKDVYMIARDIEVKGEMREKEINLLRLDTLHDEDFKIGITLMILLVKF